MNYNNIPSEIQDLPRWAISHTQLGIKRPCVGSPDDIYAFVNHKSTRLLNYPQACELASRYGASIGLFLPQHLACIDLDIKDSGEWKGGVRYELERYTTSAHIKLYPKLVTWFNSYTELSSNGKGVHIYLLTDSMDIGGKSQALQNMEILRENQYTIFTGNSITSISYAIDYEGEHERQVVTPHIVSGVKQLIMDQNLESFDKKYFNQNRKIKPVEELDKSEITDDSNTWESFLEDYKSTKIKNLIEGRWHGDFASQSEADESLIFFLYKHTKDKAKTKAFFLNHTQLGKRAKALRYGYLDRTILKAKLLVDKQDTETRELRVSSSDAENKLEKIKKETKILPNKRLPNLVGEMASYFFQNATKQIQIFADATALSMVSGLVGLVYQFDKYGLNSYNLCIGKSGIGKGDIEGAILPLKNKLKKALMERGYVGNFSYWEKSSWPSSESVYTDCRDNRSFCVYNTDCGDFWNNLFQKNNSSPLRNFKTALNDVYYSSWQYGVIRAKGAAKNLNKISEHPASSMTFLGAMQPHFLEESMNDKELFETGLFSRLLFFIYDGKRPSYNKIRVPIPEDLIEQLITVVTFVEDCISSGTFVTVGYTEEVENHLLKVENHYNKRSEETTDIVLESLYSRALEKTLKIAALCSIKADCLESCVIDKLAFDRAHTYIENNIRYFEGKLKQGLLITTDESRKKFVLEKIRQFLTKNTEAVEIKGRVVKRMCCESKSFKDPYKKGGESKLIKDTLYQLCEDGKLERISAYPEIYKILSVDSEEV